jgi:hypothetical protein
LNDHSTPSGYPKHLCYSPIAIAAFAATVALASLASLAPLGSVATAQRRQNSPTPRAADFGWLKGNWEGALADAPGTIAQMTLQPANGGAITGVVRIVEGGKVVMIELISLVQSPTGIELRFRHFGTDLESYEPVFKQSMLLKRHDAGGDMFENLEAYDKTLMSTQPRTATRTRRGNDELLAHSDIIGSDGKPAVIEVTYRHGRAGSTRPPTGETCSSLRRREPEGTV